MDRHEEYLRILEENRLAAADRMALAISKYLQTPNSERGDFMLRKTLAAWDKSVAELTAAQRGH